MVEVYCCSKRRATSLVGLSRSHGAPRALHDQRVLEHGLCRDTLFNGKRIRALTVVDSFSYEHNVTLDFSRPGKPTDNPFIESFNGSLRDECLNLNWFLSLDDAQQKVEAWRVDCNEYRPHQSLGDMTPNEFVTEHRNTPDFLSQSV